MGRDLVASFRVARRTFEEADDRLGAALSRLCFEGPEETLQLTEHAQPAILTASVAAYRVLRETTGLHPAAMAGHSLGEWSALVASGALPPGIACDDGAAAHFVDDALAEIVTDRPAARGYLVARSEGDVAAETPVEGSYLLERPAAGLLGG